MKRILSLAFCFVLASFAMASCSGDSEPFAQKEYTADPAQVAEIVIDVRDRRIDVAVSEDNQIHILYSENNKETYDISLSSQAVLTMTSADSKEWTDFIGGKPSDENRIISLQIPDALLSALTLSTTNEDITLSPLAVTGSVTLSSNGGTIIFEGLDVGTGLSLTVKNGNIAGTVAGSYEDFSNQWEGKKGDSNLPEYKDGGAKTLQVSSNNGDVKVEFVP